MRAGIVLISILTVVFLSVPSCKKVKKDIKEDFVTAPFVQRGREYPMINSEGRVRVSVHAPNAVSVKLDICGVKYPLKRAYGGLWVGESDPLDEGFHYYQIQINGGSVPDPSSLYYYGAGRWGSGVDIPPEDHEFYELRKEVPQGQVRGTYYWSETKQEMRHIFVYTPPGYDRDPEKRYPVLYLLPGGGESEYSWVQQGCLPHILDNLLAEGKAEPFLAVMENCMLEHPYDWETDFNNILINDLMPMVDSTFRTIPDKAHRAMAGFSYGGYQSKLTAFEHPDLFSAIGLFSGGTVTVEQADEHPEFKEGIGLVFVSFGTREIENPVFGIEPGTDPEKETADLKASGVNAVYYLSQGTEHEWLSVRRGLYQFSRLIFK